MIITNGVVLSLLEEGVRFIHPNVKIGVPTIRCKDLDSFIIRIVNGKANPVPLYYKPVAYWSNVAYMDPLLHS